MNELIPIAPTTICQVRTTGPGSVIAPVTSSTAAVFQAFLPRRVRVDLFRLFTTAKARLWHFVVVKQERCGFVMLMLGNIVVLELDLVGVLMIVKEEIEASISISAPD